MNRSLSLSAVVNVGWCWNQFSDEWVRSKDFATKETHEVVVDPNSNEEYNVDIDVMPV